MDSTILIKIRNLLTDIDNIKLLSYTSKLTENIVELEYKNKLHISIIENISDSICKLTLNVSKKDLVIINNITTISITTKINSIYPSFNNDLFIINRLINIIRNNNIIEIENIITELNKSIN